jgi:L-proline amide hydrolase
VQPFVDGIPDVRWEVFADSSHMPHVEEEERYLQVVGDFLDEHDATTAADTPSGDRSTRA